VAVLLQVPVENGIVLLVEVEREDIPSDLVLASPRSGGVAAKATRSLGEALEQLGPVLQTIRTRLLTQAPDQFSVEFGVKLGGETGLVLAKGTAEANLKFTMTWNRGSSNSAQ
jgi:hypothetical protein